MIRRIFMLVISSFLIVSLVGCEALVRKFTRKPKKEDLPREEMVVAPVEYQASLMSKEELYRQYFLYWKSWHDELVESLSYSTNQKKQISCANEAIKNLEQVKLFLKEEKQKKLERYLTDLKELKDAIVNDIYTRNSNTNRQNAERIKRNILQNFSYQKIKDDLA